MEFGLQLLRMDFQQLRDTAQMAEGLGYQLLTVPDHIVMEGPERQYDPQQIVYDSMIQAAVLAEATKTVRIGHLVLCNLFRHPAITAQALATIDQLSNGRLLVGIGTGWTETEFRMTGIAFPDITTRLRMLDEALTCMQSLWTKERTTFAGEFYRFEDAILWPKPMQAHAPVLLGGGGKGLLRLAAKYADYLNIIPDSGKPGYIALANIAKLTDESFRTKIRFVREEAARHGRDGKAIQISNFIFSVVLTDSPEATRATAEGMAPMFNTAPEGVLRSPMSLIGTPDECIEELRRRRREWDVTQVFFAFPGEESMQRLAQQVIPHVA
jgi:probable F420-dependent oxidoreductase